MKTLREIFEKRSYPYRDDKAMSFTGFTQAIADYEASKWVSVDEPPSENCSVLVLDPNNPFDGGFCVVRYSEYNKSFYEGSDAIHPTHWQPLPSKPTK